MIKNAACYGRRRSRCQVATPTAIPRSPPTIRR
jgi:hypothetical protein